MKRSLDEGKYGEIVYSREIAFFKIFMFFKTVFVLKVGEVFVKNARLYITSHLA